MNFDREQVYLTTNKGAGFTIAKAQLKTASSGTILMGSQLWQQVRHLIHVSKKAYLALA